MFFTLLNVHISIETKEQLLKQVSEYLKLSQSEKPLTIVTPNPEQIVLAQKNPEFRELLNTADIALPDGVGIVWGCRLSVVSCKLAEAIPGIDFMEDLVSLAAERRYPVALIGGWEGVAQKALDKLKERYTGLEGWAEEPSVLTIQNYNSKFKNEPTTHNSQLITSHGDTDAYFEKLAKQIIDSGVRLVFVGLGAPKQEFFIKELTAQLSTINYQLSTVLMSVGGAFDEISGKIPRSPDWISTIGLKWLWRLMLEPWRIGRQAKLVKFVWLVLKQRVSGKI